MKKKTVEKHTKSEPKPHSTSKSITSTAVSDDAVDAFLSGASDVIPVHLPTAAAYPEDSWTMEQVTEQIKTLGEKMRLLQQEFDADNEVMLRLYKRFNVLKNSITEGLGIEIPEQKREDKRSEFNPIKYLKISAKKSYGWAKGYKKTADSARLAVYAAVHKRAKTHYFDHPDVEPYLNTGVLASQSRKPTTLSEYRSSLPPAVVAYIEDCHKHYDLIKIEAALLDTTINAQAETTAA